MRGKVKSFFTAIGFMGVSAVCQLIGGMLCGMLIGFSSVSAAAGGFQDKSSGSLQKVIFNTLPTVLIIASLFTLFLLWLTYNANKRNLFAEVFELPVTLKMILLAIGIGVTIWCVNFALVTFIERIGSIIAMQNKLNESPFMINKGNIVILLLAMGIVGPLCEEVLFRGVILQTLRKEFSIAPAVIIQAVLFGIFHLNIIQSIYTTLLGLILGYVTYRVHSLWPAIVSHMVNNIVGVTVGVQLQQTEKSDAVILLVFTAGAMIIGFLLFFISKNAPIIANESLSDENLAAENPSDKSQTDEETIRLNENIF